MKIGDFDLDKKVMVVAEIGNNHEGDFALAKELINLAAEAGAHAVKFQTFKTEQFVSQSDKIRFEKMKSFELSPEQFCDLSAHAQEANVLFLSTPLDIPSVCVLKPIVNAIKIASGDISFFPLLKVVAQAGKPIILSTGIATIKEIREAKSTIESRWDDLGIDQELAILHCVSSYPVPNEEVNLGAILELKKDFHCTVGYSDHSLGIEAAALSVALGARIVEKHFTIDKNYSDFRDHKLAADPKEFRELVNKVELITKLLGHGKKVPQNCEIQSVNSIRRSIAAKHDLAPGTIIDIDDLIWVRPAGGIAPGNENLVVGQQIEKFVKAGQQIVLPMLRSEKVEL